MSLFNLTTVLSPSLSDSDRPAQATTTRRSSRLLAGVGLIAAALSFAAGCGDTNGAGGAGGSGGGSGTGGSGGTTAASGSDLDGTWETACYNKAKTSLTYDALALVGTYTEYSDDACTTPIHISTWTGTGAVTGETSGGDTKIDLSFASFKSVALTAENAALNNMYQYCGMTDWAANVEKDVLGKQCYGFSIPEGGKSLDIYRVEAATLKFGKGAIIGADVTEADRPTVIDDTRLFTRK